MFRLKNSMLQVSLAAFLTLSIGVSSATAFDGPAQQRSQGTSILFGDHSAKLSAKSQNQLRAIVSQLKSAKSVKISVAAALTEAGNPPAEARLAVARENAIIKFLKQLGLKASFTAIPATATDPSNPSGKRIQISYFWFG